MTIWSCEIMSAILCPVVHCTIREIQDIVVSFSHYLQNALLLRLGMQQYKVRSNPIYRHQDYTDLLSKTTLRTCKVP